MTTSPPLLLFDITHNTAFPWRTLERERLDFLSTRVIRQIGVAWEVFSGVALITRSTEDKRSAVLGVVDGPFTGGKPGWASKSVTVTSTSPVRWNAVTFMS